MFRIKRMLMGAGGFGAVAALVLALGNESFAKAPARSTTFVQVGDVGFEESALTESETFSVASRSQPSNSPPNTGAAVLDVVLGRTIHRPSSASLVLPPTANGAAQSNTGSVFSNPSNGKNGPFPDAGNPQGPSVNWTQPTPSQQGPPAAPAPGALALVALGLGLIAARTRKPLVA